jgi:hypothetical protein
MPIATRTKLAALAVALLVTAIVGAPALAIDGAGQDGGGVQAFAKPTNKPPHPHATPTPTPAPTATPRPTPTPKPTAKPNPTPAPTAIQTARPGRADETPKPTKRPGRDADASDAPSVPASSDDGEPSAPVPGGAGVAGGRGPSPEVLGIAVALAALVGLGTLWFLTRSRRRRSPPLPSIVAARVQAMPPLAERWTNVRLDDNEALPDWLRALAEPDRGPLALPQPERPTPPTPVLAPAPRPPRRFAEPLGEGTMRLLVGATGGDLLDQPSDEVGVLLTTLVEGDEVEIQDLADPWVRVLTSLGSSGWMRSEALSL